MTPKTNTPNIVTLRREGRRSETRCDWTVTLITGEKRVEEERREKRREEERRRKNAKPVKERNAEGRRGSI